MTTELLRRSLEMIGRLRDDLNGMEDNESLELSLYSVDLENQISAALSQPASEDAWLSGVIKQIAELPDRNSPEGQPEMMLVTAKELTSILRVRPAKESGK